MGRAAWRIQPGPHDLDGLFAPLASGNSNEAVPLDFPTGSFGSLWARWRPTACAAGPEAKPPFLALGPQAAGEIEPA